MKRLAATLVLTVALLAATAATGAVSVFKTSFSSRSEYSAVKKLAGDSKACKRSWRDKKAIGVVVKGGEVDCAMRTPVEGDSKQPDLIVQAVGQMTKETDKKVRDSVYIGVTVRSSRREGYELRVFPKSRRWQLLKSGEVLEENREKSIAGLDEKNRISISAIGSTVKAKANGKRLAVFKDRNAEQVSARGTGLTYGSRKRAKKAEGVGFFDKLKVQVPTP
jgi:hypothetical protein